MQEKYNLKIVFGISQLIQNTKHPKHCCSLMVQYYCNVANLWENANHTMLPYSLDPISQLNSRIELDINA